MALTEDQKNPSTCFVYYFSFYASLCHTESQQ